MPWRFLALLLTLPYPIACSTDYVGQEYPPVVDADEVETVIALPAGTRVIGTVTGSCVSSRSDSDELLDVLVDPPCSVSVVEQRMARKSAKKGGELLVHLECDEYEDVSQEFETVDDELVLVTTVTTTLDCTADVARSWEHDRA